MDVAAKLFEQVCRPVPAVGGFQDDFGVLAGGGNRPREGRRVFVHNLGDVDGVALLVTPHDHTAAAVQVDTERDTSGPVGRRPGPAPLFAGPHARAARRSFITSTVLQELTNDEVHGELVRSCEGHLQDLPAGAPGP